jgi:electron transfer flavoprotein beta subunit
MRIAVWVREIWDTRDLVGEPLDPAGHPKWGEWEGRFDPEDLNALEMALQVKDRYPETRITALSVGDPRKMDVLRECLYRGVDQSIRLGDAGQGLGISGEARLVAAALGKLGAVDALFTGVQLNEGEAVQRGPFVAALLNWPVVSYVEAMEAVGDSGIQLRRAIEGGIQLVEARCPVVVSVGVALLKEDPRAPRSAKAKLKLQHKKTPIPEWGPGELGVDQGILEGAVRIAHYKPLEQRAFPSKRVNGASGDELQGMVAELRQRGLLR